LKYFDPLSLIVVHLREVKVTHLSNYFRVKHMRSVLEHNVSTGIFLVSDFGMRKFRGTIGCRLLPVRYKSAHEVSGSKVQAVIILNQTLIGADFIDYSTDLRCEIIFLLRLVVERKQYIIAGVDQRNLSLRVLVVQELNLE
jgi:hypothetical protein